MPPITRLLVANRGEIARRVFRTAKAMGMQTVAVYAAGDVDAPFVTDADEAVALPGRTAAETYLDVEAVVAAARRTGCDAVHPGYGFLSENAELAQAVADAGMTWVGPPPRVIAAMGDKLGAKRIVADAGVPLLASVEVEDGTDLQAAAAEVGFPALVKASAGGGGKGMRVVERAADLPDAVAAAGREALAAFGDSTVFLEPYVTGARHVEIQVLGDRHGNLVHCFERECSIQRRHQKVVEEAPSPAVDTELRERMTAAALAAAKVIGYESAGTVEFLLAADGRFFFLEVNTRLQVEHPVTEAITGLDLVREQLLIAQGERLGFAQGDLSITGHAIEVRLYAEDPEHDFLPVVGTLHGWEPAPVTGVRFDSGVETGSEIGVEFDPMLAKVIAHAPTRPEAAARLATALARTRMHGIVTNRDFLVATLRHPAFLAGDTTTDFIERVAPDRSYRPSADERRKAAVVAALAGQDERRRAARVLTTFPSGWRNSVMPPERTTFRHRAEDLVVEYRSRRDGSFDVRVGDTSCIARLRSLAGGRADVDVDGVRTAALVAHDGQRWWVQGAAGEIALVEVARFPEPEADGVAGGLTAPMPGNVIAVDVSVGDVVEEGQLLVIIEAMKMEHRITAPLRGRVADVRVSVGDGVGNGDLLVVVEEEA